MSTEVGEDFFVSCEQCTEPDIGTECWRNIWGYVCKDARSLRICNSIDMPEMAAIAKAEHSKFITEATEKQAAIGCMLTSDQIELNIINLLKLENY